MSDLSRTCSILIVDDHPFVRTGIRDFVEREKDLVVSAEAGGCVEALECCETNPPDVALIDLSLGDTSGLDLIKDLRIRFPDIKMLVLSMQDEMLYAERVLRAGASGYISKNSDPDELISAIRCVQGGEVYASPSVQQRIMKSVQTKNVSPVVDPIQLLSDRELAVFEQIGKGRSTAQIAEAMSLSVKTIETYRARIKSKLNLDTAAQMVQHAVQWRMDLS
jgi:DNA-binding NarL/FixJ family response regulator